MVKSNKELATKVLKYLEDNNINIKVAIMGCVVNGINEGKNATIGLAGTKNSYILFKNGQKIILNISYGIFENQYMRATKLKMVNTLRKLAK